MNEWKYVDMELPPRDGTYLVRNHKDDYIGFLQYDGYCFRDSCGVAYNPQTWKEAPLPEKRYGKIPQTDNQKEIIPN